MAVEWKATCGTVNESIKCKRADFDDVKKAYDIINMANPNDMNLQETFRKAIIDGTPLSEYINYKNFFNIPYKRPYPNYSNTCALQVSYALNYGKMPLHTLIKEREYNALYDTNREYLYILGADYIGRFLQDKWGKAEISQTLHNNIDRQTMLIKLKGQKGIATMRGNHFINNTLVGSFSHATLWNEKEFVDVQNKTNDNWLLELIGYDKENNLHIYRSQTFNFWELL